MKRTGFLAGLMLSVMLAFAEQAQNTPFIIDNQPNYFAVAIGVAPDCVGSDDYQFVANLAMRYWLPISKAFDLGLGIGTSYASDNFNDTFFNVNATDFGLSGLSVFSANGGIAYA
jgi:hypothetical protein